MIKIATSAALVLAAATVQAFAQSQANCDQVRQGIAQYGYAAARQYAVEHYTPEEVKAADRCAAQMGMAAPAEGNQGGMATGAERRRHWRDRTGRRFTTHHAFHRHRSRQAGRDR